MHSNNIPKMQRALALAKEAMALVKEACPNSETTAEVHLDNAVDRLQYDVASETHGKDGLASSFVAHALAQAGKPYVYGVEVDLKDPSPKAFDCSELVEWAAAQVGVGIPDGSAFQGQHCDKHHTLISVNQALMTRGALLFRAGHVAISLGDGRTIEARGAKYGVDIFEPSMNWLTGALVPGMKY